MKTNENQFVARIVFIETLSAESIARTGYGIYVFLSAFEIEELYGHYQIVGAPVRDYARQCVKTAVGN
jgi:hypothetical protein